jgi:hypothetical protein
MGVFNARGKPLTKKHRQAQAKGPELRNADEDQRQIEGIRQALGDLEKAIFTEEEAAADRMWAQHRESERLKDEDS